jgi:hypothetical protein
MKHQRRLLLGAVVALASPVYAQMADVPAAVKPPAEHRAAMTWTGTGELSYECRAKADGSTHEWAFVGPNAKLTDAGSKALMGNYYAGPTWEAADGSRISGKQVAVAPSTGDNIPLQLVKAEGGSGSFKDVTYIQRINTWGGTAPKDPCNGANTGARKTVPYSADYVFYKAT